MNLNPLSPNEAVKLGDGIYEAVLSNWGNRGETQDPDNQSIMYPPAKVPGFGGVMGISIAPRSDVDRLTVFYNNHSQGELPLMHQVISTDTPFIGSINGPIVLRAHPACLWADTYAPCGVSPVTAPFGPVLGNPPPGSTGGPIFVNPSLRALLAISGQQRFLPPNARAPLYHEYAYVFSAVGLEKITKAISIIGRKFIRVFVQASGSASVTVKLTGLFTHIGNTVDLIEVPLGDPVTLNASINECTSFMPSETLSINFLLVKATTTALPTKLTVSIGGRD
jgi:hypothetical protein